MDLKTLLANPPQGRDKPKTQLDKWFDELAPEDQNTVMSGITDERWPHMKLSALLVEHMNAPDLSDSTFGAWRKRKRDAA